jgi:predicted MFS family arabinose efflux permease
VTSLWRDADFRRLWIGQAISEMGSRISREGIPLTAVLLLGATPFTMSLLTVTGAIAVFLVSIFAGVWIDRVRRRPVLIATDIARALVIGWIPFAAYNHWLRMEQLYAVAAFSAVLNVFFQVAYQSWLPWLVERRHILDANSKMATASSIAEIAGPGLTGILVTALTAPVAIFWDAISFLWSALWIWRIRKPEPAPQAKEHVELWADIHEGVAAIRDHKVLRLMALRSATHFYFGGFFSTLYVLYAIRILKLTPFALGIAIAVGGVSALCGALFGPRIVARFGLGWTLRGSALILGTLSFFLPLAHGPMWLATLFMMGQQSGDICWSLLSICETSYRQTVIPDHLLGRVNSFMHLLSQGIWPIGALTCGLIADPIGIRNAMWIGAAGIFISSLWLLSPEIGRLNQKDFALSET